MVSELRIYILKEHYINERNNSQTHPGRRPLYMFNDEHFLQEIIILLAVQKYNESYPDKKINFNTEIINAVALAHPRALSLPMLFNFMTTFLPTVDGENVIDKIVKLLENDYDTDDKKFIKSLEGKEYEIQDMEDAYYYDPVGDIEVRDGVEVAWFKDKNAYDENFYFYIQIFVKKIFLNISAGELNQLTAKKIKKTFK